MRYCIFISLFILLSCSRAAHITQQENLGADDQNIASNEDNFQQEKAQFSQFQNAATEGVEDSEQESFDKDEFGPHEGEILISQSDELEELEQESEVVGTPEEEEIQPEEFYAQIPQKEEDFLQHEDIEEEVPTNLQETLLQMNDSPKNAEETEDHDKSNEEEIGEDKSIQQPQKGSPSDASNASDTSDEVQDNGFQQEGREELIQQKGEDGEDDPEEQETPYERPLTGPDAIDDDKTEVVAASFAQNVPAQNETEHHESFLNQEETVTEEEADAMLLETEGSCKVYLYVDSRYRGKYRWSYYSGERTLPSYLDEEASSIKTTTGCYVCLYTGKYYSGSKLCVTGSISSFKDIGLNDKIRSYKQGRIDYNRDAIFYEDSDYRGFGIVSSYDTSNAGTVDNEFSSVRVPRGRYLRVYVGFGYTGKYHDIVGDVAHFSYFDMNDRVSSWRFKTFPSSYAVFYQKSRYRGWAHVSTGSKSHAGFYDNAFSSVKVPSGKYIRVYADFYYKGFHYDIVKDISDLRDTGLNDRISSWQIKSYPSNYAVFYQHSNYRGFAYVSSSDVSHAGVVDNYFSSVKIMRGKYLRVYAGFYYKGFHFDLTRDCSNLKDMGLNDRISSWQFRSYPSRYVTFYDDDNFGGFAYIASDTDSHAGELDNKFNSVRIPSGYYLRVYAGFNFKGDAYSLAYSCRELKALSMKNRISSWKLVKFPKRYAIFYEKEYYGGASILARYYYSYLPGFNNKISSVRVSPGYYVKFWDDSKFGGEYMRINQNVPSFKAFGWDNRVSSLRVYVQPKEYALLYFQTYFRGYPIMVAWDQANLGRINDKIRSVKIIGKIDKFIRLYEDKNFEGKHIDIFKNTTYLGNLDKKSSSFSFTSDPKLKANAQPLVQSTNSGCYTLYDIMRRFPTYFLKLTNMLKSFAPNDNIKDLLDGVMLPFIDQLDKSIKKSEVKSLKKGGGNAFCIRVEDGDKILNAITTNYHNLHGCNRIPVNPDGKYTVISAGIKAKYIKKQCPTALLQDTDILSMCAAIGITSGKPTLALVTNGNLMNCVASHPKVIAKSKGFSKKFAVAIQALGISQAGVGVSVPRDFRMDVEIFDFYKWTTIKMKGNYFDYVEANPTKITKKLKLPPYIKITAKMSRMAMVPTEVFSNPLDLDSWRRAAFAFKANGFIEFPLAKVTKNLISNTPKIKLIEANGLVTALPSSVRNWPPTGLYYNIVGKDLSTAIKQFFPYVSDNFGGLFYQYLPKDVTMDKMKAVDDDRDNILAFMVNQYAIGFALKLKVRHPLYKKYLAVALEIEFKYNFSKKVPTFRFSFDVHGPDFVSLFKDGAHLIARSVKGFYGKIGDIIALGDFDKFTDNPAKWSIDAVKKAKKKIVDTFKNAPKEVYNFAADKVKNCGVKFIETTRDCGSKAIKGAAKCAYKRLANMDKCGYDFIRNARVCSYETIKDAATCGTTFVKCFTSCIGSIFFDVSCKCEVAKKCRIARKCKVPRTCTFKECIPTKSCPVPNSCLPW